MSEESKFECWCICELFGHSTIAGFVTEQEIGGDSFIRIDVPESDGQETFTKFYGPKAIYAITPTTEEIARQAAKSLHVRPVNLWVVPNRGKELPYHDPRHEDENGEIPY